MVSFVLRLPIMVPQQDESLVPYLDGLARKAGMGYIHWIPDAAPDRCEKQTTELSQETLVQARRSLSNYRLYVSLYLRSPRPSRRALQRSTRRRHLVCCSSVYQVYMGKDQLDSGFISSMGNEYPSSSLTGSNFCFRLILLNLSIYLEINWPV